MCVCKPVYIYIYIYIYLYIFIFLFIYFCLATAAGPGSASRELVGQYLATSVASTIAVCPLRGAIRAWVKTF